MKILALAINQKNYNNTPIQCFQNNTTSLTPICSDTLTFGKRETDGSVNEKLQELNSRFQKAVQDFRQECADIANTYFTASDEYGPQSSMHRQIDARYQHDIKLREIYDAYHLINEALSANNLNMNAEESMQLAEQFINSMHSLSQDKGFNRISGYEDIKDLLRKIFIFDNILKDKLLKNTNVENVLLFYGPSGCGKTTFATAVAEQALSNFIEIKPYEYPDEFGFNDNTAIYNKIMDTAIQAKDIYKKTGKRTIIVLNEAELVLNNDNEILDKYIEFFSSCSDKYKCTVFLTTNFPEILPEKILDKKMTAIKVGVKSICKSDCYDLIRNQALLAQKCLSGRDVHALVENLYSNANLYSNSQIVNGLKEIWKHKNSTIEDYIRFFNPKYNQEYQPSVTKEDIKRYEEIKRKFDKQ